MNKFWPLFFMFWPILAIVSFVIAPSMDWWFPGPAMSKFGEQIDNLFYLILVIVAVTFVGTHVALGYVLWRGVDNRDTKAWFSHGSHNLEVLWSIAPAGILMFISLYQLDVWMQFRVKSHFPEGTTPIAEVTARQFEWRIRYAAPGKKLMTTPQPDDLYTVNDLHVPFGRPVSIRLRTMDVQHSFFVPELRVKQDAVPGTVIPVWFDTMRPGEYDLTCAELCGWGHYKMRGRVVAEKESGFQQYLLTLQAEQNFDGVTRPEHSGAQIAEYGIEDSQ
ncbi:MAG: cytochrome c oxidase subunit II [Planctomycetota bacterium]|nr:cytochrome c oxidase subunit II [Planctomycetota bacterium]